MISVDWSSFALGVVAAFGFSTLSTLAWMLLAGRHDFDVHADSAVGMERFEVTDTDVAWLRAAGEYRRGEG